METRENFLIDTTILVPQPTQHEWSPPVNLGNDGNGAPIFAKYRTVTLRAPLTLCKQEWTQFRDDEAHDVTLPAPGTTDDFTEYTDVYINQVSVGSVGKQSGMDTVEMEIVMVDAS